MNIKHILFSCLMLVAMASAAFDPCKFNFGRGWKNNANLTGMDYVTIYGGDNGAWNNYWHGSMVTAARDAGATPVFYGYLTAFMARANAGLADCDVGEPSLCSGGANYIRQNRTAIINLYKTYAQNTAAIIGATGASIWLIEPDLYQYSVSGDNQRVNNMHKTGQAGGGIPDADIALYFKDIATAIRTYLPSAKVAIDLSPWMTNPTTWYANFDKSIIDYAFTSGGRTEAGNTKIRSADAMTWASAHSITGKFIIADAGYGTGGGGTGHDANWDVEANIKARITDGVLGITQFNARDDWNSAILTALRPKLPSGGTCQVSSSSTLASSSSAIIPSSSSSRPSSSSAIAPSSSSAIIPSSSSAQPSSSSAIIPSSSSSRPSSSSAIVPSSSSAIIPSSSSSRPSSSSAVNPSSNFVRNGGFSQGTTGWALVPSGSAGASGTTAVNAGVFNLVVNWGGGAQEELTLAQTGITLPAGEYVLSFTAWAELGASRPLGYRVNLGTSNVCTRIATLSENPSDLQCTFSVATQTTVSLEFLAGGPYWQDVQMDNVSIVSSSGQTPVRQKLQKNFLSEIHIQRTGNRMEIFHTATLKMELLNTAGRSVQVIPSHLGSTSLDLGPLPRGIYLLRFSGKGQSRAIPVLRK